MSGMGSRSVRVPVGGLPHIVTALLNTGIHRRGCKTMIYPDDPVSPPSQPAARNWWDHVYGPLDPLGAQYLAITWRRERHGQQCPMTTTGGPYDCSCWHRAQAIVAASLLRDAQREGRYT